MLEIYKGPIAPDLVFQLLPCDEFTGTREEQYQYLERLAGEADLNFPFRELTGCGVGLERPKRNAVLRILYRPHTSPE